MASKKRMQDNAEEAIKGILSDINAPEETMMAIGFIAWTSINDAYSLGYKNASKKFAVYTEGEKNE